MVEQENGRTGKRSNRKMVEQEKVRTGKRLNKTIFWVNQSLRSFLVNLEFGWPLFQMTFLIQPYFKMTLLLVNLIIVDFFLVLLVPSLLHLQKTPLKINPISIGPKILSTLFQVDPIFLQPYLHLASFKIDPISSLPYLQTTIFTIDPISSRLISRRLYFPSPQFGCCYIFYFLSIMVCLLLLRRFQTIFCTLSLSIKLNPTRITKQLFLQNFQFTNVKTKI